MSGALAASIISAQAEFPSSLIICTDDVLNPLTATATVSFRTDGQIFDHDSTDKGDWIIPNGAAPDDYEIRANTASPDTPEVGTMDTWFALSSQQSWSELKSGFGSDIVDFTIDIRKGSGPIIRTRAIRLRAIVDI